MRLIHSMINNKFSISQGVKYGLFEVLVPHHNARVKKLSDEWFTPKPWKSIPMEHIKNYFGEELGLYFC